MISGSAVANVVVTGSFTIPLMKRTGFRPHIAGAVEAAASSGGQFMPPIMGAAAFIIPDMIGSTYFDVAKAAFLPGLLYFLAIFFMVDFEAIKMNISGLSKKELPSAKAAVKESGHLLLPVFVLIYLLAVVRTSPTLAAFWSVIAVVIASILRKSTRMNFNKILLALEEGAYAAIIVVSACALGGIIIGCMMLTGLGMSLSTILVDFSHGSLMLLLLLTMIASLILGMGMTTTACYIILAILVGPALIKMGVDPMAAHLFIFYFGIISAITPPVAVAAYAGAGIAGSDPMKTGYAAWRLGLSAFILPFMFVYGHTLLLKGSMTMILLTIVTSVLGIYALSAAIQNYLFGNLGNAKRIVLLIGSLLLIKPGWKTDLVGFFLVLFIFLSQKYWKAK
jgi:TRAP transporter 4TM/12TM fusion protein